MTIPAASPTFVQIPGNGFATNFAAPMKCFQSTDVVVGFIVGASYLRQNSGYSITNIDNNGGFNVLFTVAPPIGTLVDIRTNTPQTQGTEFSNLGSYLPENTTECFDRLTREMQDLTRLTYQFGMHGPDTESVPWPAFPGPSARANTQPIFDNNGLPALGILVSGTISTSILAPFLNLGPTLAEISTGVTIINEAFPTGCVDRYATNTSPGTTDMTAAIKAAWKVCVAQGGGVISFIKGAVYAITSLDATNPSVNIANQNSDGSINGTPFQVQIYCLGGSNITFDFAGAVLKSTLTGGGIGFLLDNCTNIDFKKPNFTGTQVQGGGVVSFGTVTGGSGYVNGTYKNVLMTGGTGQGCACTIVVTGGAVTSCVPTYPGGSSTASLAQGYQIGDALSTSNANLGGSGSGFSVPVTSSLGAGNVVQTASILPICVTSNSGLSSGITTYDLTATKCFLGFACIDGLNTNGIVSNNISLLGHTAVNGGSEYGVNLNNGGDGTYIENLYTFQVNRPHFFYGCQGVTIARLTSEQTNYGFGSIIKSYSRSTSGISINVLHRNAPGNPTVHTSIQVQCDPAVVAPPPTVKNIYIKHDDFNVDQSNAVEFDYFAGSGGNVQTATSTLQLFDQIWLQGITAGIVISNVKLTTAAAQCQINYDNFEAAWSAILGSSTDIRNGLGFISSRAFFSTMSLTFGGTTVTGTSIAVDTSIADGLCTVKGTCTLTAKNGSGAAALILPFKSRLDGTANSLGVALGVSSMTSLTPSPMIGILPANSNVMSLVQQAATGNGVVSDTNFSTTSVVYFQISYPI